MGKKGAKDESREPISRDGMLLSAAAPLGEFYIFFLPDTKIFPYEALMNVLISEK